LTGRQTAISTENVDEFAKEMLVANRPLGMALLSLSRMTIVPTMLVGGVKSNSVPAGCTLVCDVRTLPHQDEAYVRSQVEGILEGIDGASYELIYTAIPGASSYDTEFAAAVRRATQVALGRSDLHWLPSLVAGFTDSRLVRPLGTVVYGFNPEHPDVDPNIPSGAHGANESTDIRSLVLKTKMLVALAFDVLGGHETPESI
jgi:acetylornithine deacetylase/succinyl-diaminopimelate desuccinylase-like protein